MGGESNAMKQIFDEQRILDLIELLGDFAMGNFDKRLALTDKLDELDSIVGGVNMLGEELAETSMSRSFFKSIFSAIQHPLIIVDATGNILTANDKSFELFSFEKGKLVYMCHSLFTKQLFEELKTKLDSENLEKVDRRLDHLEKGEFCYYSCRFSKLKPSDNQQERFMISIKDVTEFVNHEQEILKVVVETQENERNRLAKDLHDSLGQELAAMKLMLSHFGSEGSRESFIEGHSIVTNHLNVCINHLREICFDLTPSVFDTAGLKSAVHELVFSLSKYSSVDFNIDIQIDEELVDKNKQLVFYRIIQEFFSNSLKHSQAKKLFVSMRRTDESCKLELWDDGVGCDIETAINSNGNGLTNIISRVLAYKGRYVFESEENKGFKLTIIT